MSRTLPWPPPNYQRGYFRKDKKRRSRQGHIGDSSSSRLPDGVLEDMFSSLTIHNVLAAGGSSGDCGKDRKRKSCQEQAGDLINRLPDEVLENMFSSLAIQGATVTSSVSRTWGRLWNQSPVLVLGEHNILAEDDSDCTTSTDCIDPDSRTLRSNEFIKRVNDLLLRHQGIGVQVFEVHFDLNSTHADHLDKWVQFASDSDAQDVGFHLCKNGISCSRHSVTASPYNFPLQCFGDGQGSSLRRLCLTNCIFRPPLHSSGFSSLLQLGLTLVMITDSDIQSIFSCCPVLCYLRLRRCEDLVNLRISHEPLLRLDIYSCKKLKSVEIRSYSLCFFDYDGHKIGIKYVCTPNMRKIVTKFKARNCSLSQDLLAMKSLERITLSFLSPLEEPSFIQYEKKFTALKFVSMPILPSWNNVLGVAYLLKATPYVIRLHLEACSGEHHYPGNVLVPWPDGISVKKLRTILVGGFTAQAPLIELLACLTRIATGLKFLQIDPHHHRCKEMGKWFREDVGDEAARDHVRNATRATVGSMVPSSVKFVVK